MSYSRQILGKFIFFESTNFITVFWPKLVCLRRNHQLFLIKRNRIYFIYNVLLHMLNVYQITIEEHQVVDS